MLPVAGKNKPPKIDRAPGTKLMSPREVTAYGMARSRRSGNQRLKEERWKAKNDAVEAVLPDLNSAAPIRGSRRARAFAVARGVLIGLIILTLIGTVLSMIFDR